MSKKTIIIVIISLLINLIYLIPRGFDELIYYSDAFFISGFSILLIGGLSVLSNLGAFNIFGYSSYYVTNNFKENTTRKYANYSEYAQEKHLTNAKKTYNFIPYTIVGLTWILLSLLTLLF